MYVCLCFFFFQAEDGIRDYKVTGVQTCALPILAWACMKAILALMPAFTLPSEADVTLNIPVLLFTMAATMLAGVLFGCAPAFQAMRLNLNDTLKEGGRGGVGTTKNRIRYALVLAEFSLALTLLAAAGLMVHSFWNIT